MPLLAVGIISGLLWWAAEKTDRIAASRQEQFIDFAVSQLRIQVAHSQESSTVWDEAVRAVEDPPRLEWIDANLGSWMHRYFRLDALFVLKPDRTPIYAFDDGAIREPTRFDRVAGAARPLLDRLQNRLRRNDTEGISDEMLSIGESDFAIVEGHPSVVSVKPVLSDTGAVTPKPGTEALHIAVRYLDSDFLDMLEQKYLVEDVQFQRKDLKGYSSSPLASEDGMSIGYLVWKPFQPGRAIFRQVMPSLIVCGLMFMAILLVLMNVLEGRSARLDVSEQALSFARSHDPVTGLPNRSQMEMALAARNDDFDVLYLDIDDFKSVTDALSLRQSEAILVEAGRRLSQLGEVYHLDSDRFILILASRTEAALRDLCERILAKIRQPLHVDSGMIALSASIGVAKALKGLVSAEEAIRRADIALYHAKAAGKGRYALFGEHMEALLQERRSLEADLRLALNSGDQFLVLYQPVFAIDGVTIVGAEALVRWRHPEKGMIAPDRFIPIAEETGGITRLGEIVLEQACLNALAWDGLVLAVNASAIELSGPRYVSMVQQTLKRTGFPAERLEIELTETALMKSDDALTTNIGALRGMGVKVALDDFGIGYSSLARLQQLPVDRLKIDKLFVDDLGADPAAEEFLATIIKLARSKGLSTTAEGIERAEQLDVLRRLGSDSLQGYLLGKPMPANAVEQLILKN
ncbi:putative bifunctional diguanylate cyclase/phosphodiesterase [Agrobacterium vitis]|uniref:putative bifunctional diguanylate cyclase/phosphodiesterase n=1 Tax=Agrobacterium vitis TaxID=373 RepID=UPI0018D2090D|nr:bifunctional diguanylate cyclase/phosphodiesterase [Agrobacterium vitis]